MPDMLVPLYGLPAAAAVEGVWIGRVPARMTTPALRFIEREFGRKWADETAPGLARVPSTVMAAADVESGELLGFCAWDCTALGFLGPVGTSATARGRGIGAALLLFCLHAMRVQGYGYAIVGGAGPTDFFRRVCGARVIEGSVPGIYSAPELSPGAESDR